MSPDIRIAAPHCYTYRTESPLHSEFVGRPPATLEKRIPINNLLNENGHLYLSFVEGDPNKSDFQVGSSGDRTYFYFYNLDDLTEQLKKNNFEQIKVFKVDYKKAENEYDTHTILTAKRKTTA